jgi:predicted alpha/beta hydrolase family esterase
MPAAKQRSTTRRNGKKDVAGSRSRKTVRTVRKRARTTGRRRTTNVMAVPVSKEVLFVQGGGSSDTHDSWDNKLVTSLKQALGARYRILYPRMPDEANPNPTAWKKAIARELRKVNDGVILVAHSIGAAILVDYLADGNLERKPAAVFLVATPFIGSGGWPSNDLRPTKTIAAELSAGAPLYLYHGDDDDTVPFSHVGEFAKVLPHATIHRLEGRNHQLNDDLSELAHEISLLG